MNTVPHVRSLHRRALAVAGDLVARIRPSDLARPSTCAGWDLAALMTHAIGQNHGFATAIQDGDAPVSAYAGPAELTAAGLAGLWSTSAAWLTAAVASAPVQQQVRLVEFGPNAVFPVDTVVGFHLLDTTVHSWDIAASLGESFRPDDELVAATAAVARQVPGGAARSQPGAAFGPELPAGQTDPWTAALAHLGREAAG